MKSLSITVFLAIACLICVPCIYGADRIEAWNEFQKAKNDGLPQTAVEKLEPIIKGAIADKKYAEAVKAISEKIVLEGNIQGNKAEEKIIRLEEESKKAIGPMKPIMQIILARWYWHYYEQNQWRFLDRSTTEGLDEKDFTTWDLPKLFRKIGSIHEEILSAENELQKISIDEMSGFLTPGNQPREYRPTIFDFAAYQALDFFNSYLNAPVKPQNPFEIEADSPAFDDFKTFSEWEPQVEDKDSPVFKALCVYRQLFRYHIKTGNRDALLDADLHRIAWARVNAVGENVSERYIDFLDNFVKEHSDHDHAAIALSIKAREILNRGDRVEAHRIANECIKRYEKSYGAQLCRQIIIEIEARQLQILTERVSGKPRAQIKIDYTNLTSIHFRLVSQDWKSLFTKDRYNPGYASYDEYRRIIALSPVEEWKVELPPTSDYKQATRIVDLPDIEPGFYYLIASWKEDFSESNNAIKIAPVLVSSLGLVSRTRDGCFEVLVTDNGSGEPIEGAEVDGYSYEYNKGWQRIIKGTTQSDGWFRTPADGKNLLAIAHARKETIFETDQTGCHKPGRNHPYERVYFFTDRGLYRPGQTIYYKGIAVRIDPEGNSYETIPERSVNISFRDANNQEITNIQHTTNEFGSFSGNFTAPTDRLTGAMTIAAQSISGSTVIRVEEYKRPKFKVNLDIPSEGARLNEPANVKGTAVSYTGAVVDGAKVKYRVVREVQFPYWCWWYYVAPTPPREITHGTTVTDAKGNFTVKFTAKPDRTVPEKDQPIFTYKIHADVTDGTGETRSGSTSVKAGYAAMTIGVNTPTWLQSKTQFNVSVNTSTLDGKGIPAAGSLLIHELKAPEKPARKSFLQQRSVDCPDLSDPSTWSEGKVVFEESFNTSIDGRTAIPVTLGVGAYRIVTSGRDRFNKPVMARQDIMVLDPADSKFGIKIPSHFIAQNQSVEVGENFRALWGTGYDKGRAYIEIEHRRKVIKAFWTDPSVTQYFIEVPVTEEMRGGFTVRVGYMRENCFYSYDYKVYVPWTNKNLDISFGRFSSKLMPAQEDTWTITISGPEAKKQAIEMAATLYDASLEAFMPFSWMTGFDFFRRDDSYCQSRFANRTQNFSDFITDWYDYFGVGERSYPELPYEIISNFMGYDYMHTKMCLGSNYADECMAPAPMMSMKSESPGSRGVAMEKSMAPQNMKDGAGGGGAAPEPEPEAAPEPDLDKVSARTNLNETAFFFPHMTMDDAGSISFSFTMPEALTTWRFFGFAHGRSCQAGGITAETITQKDLMVQPNPPRFVREGDILCFTAKVTNLSTESQKGRLRLALRDPITDCDRTKEFGLTEPDLDFDVPAGESRSFEWKLTIPETPGLVAYKVVGSTGKLSDGEEAVIPILSRRIFVTESLPLPIRGPAKEKFTFQKLIDSNKSDTLVHQALTVQVTSNPAWYAVQALPYLMEFPHECSEQIFNRIYANGLARHIAGSDPKIRKIFDAWKADESQGGKALLSNLEKNEQLKSVLLLETPWVRQAKSETQAKHNIGILFDANRLNDELKRGMNKLRKMQLSDGSWPWFPGGQSDSYITLYNMTGFGRLRHLGVKIEMDMALKAIPHVDAWINKIYRDILKYGHLNQNNLSNLIAFYLYGRGFFVKESPVGESAKEAVEYFLDQADKHWLSLSSRMSQAHLALGLQRFGRKNTPKKIAASLKERSVTDKELGRFWRDTELSWWWYRAPIETQAMMIEVFDEVMDDQEAVEDCKVWLLKQKQTQDWKTTKATADAIYALLLKGADLLASDKLVRVALGGQEIKPEKVEAGTGFYEKRFAGSEVKPEMGTIAMIKEDKGVAWGGIHWQYLEDMTKVTPHDTNLKLKKTLFVKKDSSKGPVISPLSGKLNVGDLLVVRIELRTDRDMEYVHMKDQRGSGLEPTEVLSHYRYQDGLAYYQSTKDTATHFYISYLPKGTYVFEYNLRVQHRGKYQTGIAEIQCMYAPEFGSHSESFLLEVE